MTEIQASPSFQALTAFRDTLRGMTVTEATAAITAAGYNVASTAAGPDRGIGVNIADHGSATVHDSYWSGSGEPCADINPAAITFHLMLCQTTGARATGTTYVDCPNVFLNWTWNETPGATTTYFQTVQAYVIDGVVQPSYQMSNGFNNATPTFRVPAAGGTVNASGKYIPCEAGVPIAFECDLQSDPGGMAQLTVNWYALGSSTVLSTTDIVPYQSWGAFAHVTATLTPPAGATKWNLFLRGLLDNVTAAS